MKGTPAIYLGKIVSKHNFRAFVYSPNGSQKLVNSWHEFEQHMAGGLWFATPDEASSACVMSPAMQDVIENITDEKVTVIEPFAKLEAEEQPNDAQITVDEKPKTKRKSAFEMLDTYTTKSDAKTESKPEAKPKARK